MKSILFSFLFLSVLMASAQEADEIKSAAKGVVYGTAPAETGEAITSTDLQSKLTNGIYEGGFR